MVGSHGEHNRTPTALDHARRARLIMIPNVVMSLALSPRSVGIAATLELRRVETPEEADRLRRLTLIDGRDPFPSDAVGFACRLYGAENSPTVADLIAALES